MMFYIVAGQKNLQDDNKYKYLNTTLQIERQCNEISGIILR